MKSPVLRNISIILLAFTVIGSLGFQCSSPNIQGGKLYLQQYNSNQQDTAKLSSAINMFRKEVTENPNSGEGWYWLGMAEGMRKNWSGLRSSWMKAKDLGPSQQADIKSNSPYMFVQAINNGSVLFQKAQMMSVPAKKEALLKDAEEAYLTATYLLPDTAAKYNGFSYLANVYIAQNRIDDAMKTLDKQISMNPNPSAFLTLGRALTVQGDNLKKEGKTEAAKEKYASAIERLSSGMKEVETQKDMNDSVKASYSGELMQALLNAYIAADRLPEAESMFKKSAEQNQNDAVAQFNYGTILLQKGDFENAILYLERAVAVNPKSEQSLQNLAAAYVRYGFKVRDEENTNNTETSNSKYKSIIEKAIPPIEKLMELQPADITVLDLAAKVYASVGNTEKANELFKKADELRSKQK